MTSKLLVFLAFAFFFLNILLILFVDLSSAPKARADFRCGQVDPTAQWYEYYYVCRMDARTREYVEVFDRRESNTTNSHSCQPIYNVCSNSCGAGRECGFRITNKSYRCNINTGNRYWVSGWAEDDGCNCISGNPICGCTPNWSNWRDSGCGGGSCGRNDMQRVRDNNCGNVDYDCQDDNAGNWSRGTCGGGSCSANEMRFTRNVRNGCQYNSYKCERDTATNWVNGTCGEGSCGPGQMRQTRNSQYGCLAESRCVDDDATNWADDACGAGSCGPNQMRQTRNAQFGCLAESRCDPRASCVREPDLVVNAFTHPGGAPGGNALVDVTVRNRGNAGTGAGFDVRLFNEFRTVTLPYPVLAAGISDTRTFTIAKPTTTGEFDATVTADPGAGNGAIAESNEGNNQQTSIYNITASPLPDLRITAFTFPGGTPGGTGTASVTVQNNSTVGTGAPFVIRINNGSGMPFQDFPPVPALAAGISRTHTFTVNKPNPAATTTYDNPPARATANPGRVISETTYGNNWREDDYTINVAGSPATYTISGGVYIDDGRGGGSAGNGTREGGESYDNWPVTIDGTARNSVQNVGFSWDQFAAGPHTVSVNMSTNPGYIITTSGFPLNTLQVNTGNPCSPVSKCDVGENVRNLDIGVILQPQDAWIQGIGGDIRADNGYVNKMPLDKEFSTNGGGSPVLDAGVVFGSPTFDMGLGKANSKGWFINNVKLPAEKKINTSYANIETSLRNEGIWTDITKVKPLFSPAINGCSTNICNFPAGTLRPGYYKANRETRFGSYSFSGGGDYVFVINSNIHFEGNITVTRGTTVTFIASGDINVESGVTQLQGIFSANKNFTVESAAVGADSPLLIEGSVIANAIRTTTYTLINRRDLVSIDNANPSVVIQMRPDFILNAPELIRHSEVKIQEVAPGE
jgi:hypothetical protein